MVPKRNMYLKTKRHQSVMYQLEIYGIEIILLLMTYLHSK